MQRDAGSIEPDPARQAGTGGPRPTGQGVAGIPQGTPRPEDGASLPGVAGP